MRIAPALRQRARLSVQANILLATTIAALRTMTHGRVTPEARNGPAGPEMAARSTHLTAALKDRLPGSTKLWSVRSRIPAGGAGHFRQS